jgi:HD superfamily phosphodiesterase
VIFQVSAGTLDDRKFTLDHFFTKFFKLRELMNTSSDREEAAKRVQFMKAFFEQLKTEIPGQFASSIYDTSRF